MLEMIASWGAWTWVALGLVLLVLEILIAGTIILWFGLAAILTGFVFVVVAAPWQVQWLTFAVLSLVCLFTWRSVAARRSPPAGFLNRGHEGLVGFEAPLAEPIVNGRGRIRFGDTTWTVSGPDLAKGARVRVVAVEGAVLRVEPA